MKCDSYPYKNKDGHRGTVDAYGLKPSEAQCGKREEMTLPRTRKESSGEPNLANTYSLTLNFYCPELSQPKFLFSHSLQHLIKAEQLN